MLYGVRCVTIVLHCILSVVPLSRSALTTTSLACQVEDATLLPLRRIKTEQTLPSLIHHHHYNVQIKPCQGLSLRQLTPFRSPKDMHGALPCPSLCRAHSIHRKFVLTLSSITPMSSS